MGLFMQKYRNKILLFTAISGALIVLYSFCKYCILSESPETLERTTEDTTRCCVSYVVPITDGF